jgi:hypothetical protein
MSEPLSTIQSCRHESTFTLWRTSRLEVAADLATNLPFRRTRELRARAPNAGPVVRPREKTKT